MAKRTKSAGTMHEHNLAYWTDERIALALPKTGPPQPYSPLADAFSMRHGEFETSVVDDRDLDSPPYSSVGKLTFRGPDPAANCISKDWYGSAWVIGSNVIMTVGHNIYETFCGGNSSDIEFLRSFRGDRQEENTYSVVRHKVVPVYRTTSLARYDVAVAVVDREFSSEIQFLPPAIEPSFESGRLLAVGYPGNFSNGLNQMRRCWGEYMPEYSDLNDRIVMATDFGGGASGGPWLKETTDGWQAVGLTVGQSPSLPGSYQGSAYFASEMRDLLNWARID